MTPKDPLSDSDAEIDYDVRAEDVELKDRETELKAAEKSLEQIVVPAIATPSHITIPNFTAFDGLKLETQEDLSDEIITIERPTHLKKGAGNLQVIAYAPTKISMGAGRVYIEGHAPVYLDSGAGTVAMIARDDVAIIETAARDYFLLVSPNLDIHLGGTWYLNGVKQNNNGPQYVKAPAKRKGSIQIPYTSCDVHFMYFNEKDLQLEPTGDIEQNIELIKQLVKK